MCFVREEQRDACEMRSLEVRCVMCDEVSLEVRKDDLGGRTSCIVLWCAHRCGVTS